MALHSSRAIVPYNGPATETKTTPPSTSSGKQRGRRIKKSRPLRDRLCSYFNCFAVAPEHAVPDPRSVLKWARRELEITSSKPTVEEIKRQYRSLSLLAHPDKSTGDREEVSAEDSFPLSIAHLHSVRTNQTGQCDPSPYEFETRLSRLVP